jgi:predicted amidohydrolase
LTVAAAQLGPISVSESREQVVVRLVAMMEEAKQAGAALIVYPEAALTAFFPHWWIDDDDELDSYFETAMPNPAVAPLFAAAKRLGVAFSFGYAELAFEEGRKRRFNTSIIVAADGTIIGKYRKIHLPGYFDRKPDYPFQNLEKRYFEVGNLGFPVWDFLGARMGMLICNDRRWPEAYRVLALQDVELILLGYNTPLHNPAMPETDPLANFHNHLSMQAGAYQSSSWIVGVAKAGTEEGVAQIGQSAIIAPSGEILAQAATLGDEVIVARCDLDLAARYKAEIFDYPLNRQPQLYKAIAEGKGRD